MFIPQIVVTPFAGVLSDRWNKKAIIAIAQDKVADQAERQEKTDKVQTVEIKELREQVVKLIVAQATTGTEIKHLTKALRASTKTDDDLKLEIKQLIKAIE